MAVYDTSHQRFLVCRAYQTMTRRKKISIFHFFIAFLNSLGRGEFIARKKRKKHARKYVFFALKFSSFWAFFRHVSTCLMSVSVSWNFEMSRLQTLPTKVGKSRKKCIGRRHPDLTYVDVPKADFEKTKVPEFLLFSAFLSLLECEERIPRKKKKNARLEVQKKKFFSASVHYLNDIFWHFSDMSQNVCCVGVWTDPTSSTNSN